MSYRFSFIVGNIPWFQLERLIYFSLYNQKWVALFIEKGPNLTLTIWPLAFTFSLLCRGIHVPNLTRVLGKLFHLLEGLHSHLVFARGRGLSSSFWEDNVVHGYLIQLYIYQDPCIHSHLSYACEGIWCIFIYLTLVNYIIAYNASS